MEPGCWKMEKGDILRMLLSWHLIYVSIFLGDLHLCGAEGLSIHDGEADCRWMVSEDSGLKWWWILNPLSLQSSWLPMCRLRSSASQHHQVKYKEQSRKLLFLFTIQGSVKELSSLRMISTLFVPGCSSPMMRLGNMTSWSVSFFGSDKGFVLNEDLGCVGCP